MHLEQEFAMQCLISQFAPLHVVIGDELGELGFGNLYLDL